MFHSTKVCFVAALLILMATAVYSQDCDSLVMVMTATVTEDTGFEGMYKYEIAGYWHFSDAVGDFDSLVFDFSTDCGCSCENVVLHMGFPMPGGRGGFFIPDISDECMVDFEAGDPDCPLVAALPTISYGVPEGQACKSTGYCNGTWAFYSWMPPLGAAVYPGAVSVEYEGSQCSGDLTGQIPDCSICLIGTDPSSWGSIKSIYR